MGEDRVLGGKGLWRQPPLLNMVPLVVLLNLRERLSSSSSVSQASSNHYDVRRTNCCITPRSPVRSAPRPGPAEPAARGLSPQSFGVAKQQGAKRAHLGAHVAVEERLRVEVRAAALGHRALPLVRRADPHPAPLIAEPAPLVTQAAARGRGRSRRVLRGLVVLPIAQLLRRQRKGGGKGRRGKSRVAARRVRVELRHVRRREPQAQR
eukprot:COSAG04_NODE_1608_length_6175_cov_1.923799_3_plen_208_part_00